MSPQVLRFLPIALLAAGCASKGQELGRVMAINDASASPHDAFDEAFPIEGRHVSVMTVPFWNVPLTENGAGTPVALEGVELCLAGARPYGSSYDAFFRYGPRPCSAPSTLGASVVVDGVPANAEALLRASRPGYRSTIYAATTTLRDLDGAGNPDAFQMHLDTNEALARALPRIDVGLGSIEVVLATCGLSRGLVCKFPEGATITLDAGSPPGSGPYYAGPHGVVPGARATLAGEVQLSHPDPATEAATYFMNLPPAEYAVSIDHPLLRCGPWSPALYGHAGRAPGELRAPVLAGQTTFVVSACVCKDPDTALCPGFDSDSGARDAG